MTENELQSLGVADGFCLFQDRFTGKKYNAPLIYDSKYDVYKCSLHKHYCISREEYGRRRRGMK